MIYEYIASLMLCDKDVSTRLACVELLSTIGNHPHHDIHATPLMNMNCGYTIGPLFKPSTGTKGKVTKDSSIQMTLVHDIFLKLTSASGNVFL